jgi:exonuclease SbcC
VPFYLQKVSIEGIRGINKKLTLKLSKGLNLLYGPNGSGKTSIAQAIEWCITGNISYLTASEFKREDAIVNQFHPNKRGEVSLTLTDKTGRNVIITRRRKMSKSTTRGTSILEVNIDGKVLVNKEAQNTLMKILGITFEDFPKAVYLHQEAIRDIVITDPKERSRIIDKLLGTIEIRDLIDALDVKRAISAAKKRIQARIDTLERDKIQFVIGMKERLSKQREILISKGYQAVELSIEYLTAAIEDITKDIINVANQLGAPIPTIGRPEPSINVLGEILSKISDVITKLDRFRSNAYRTQVQRRTRLEDLKRQYNQAENELEEFHAQTLDSISNERNEVNKQITQLNSLIYEKQEVLTSLIHAKARLDASTNQISSYKERLNEIEKKYGDEKRHLELIQEKKQSISDLDREIKKYATYDKLLNLALQYISDVKPKECPVCDQPINYALIAERLKKEVKVHIIEELSKLRSKQEQAKGDLEEIKLSLKNYRNINSLLISEKAKLELVMKEIEVILKKKVEPGFDIDSEISNLRQDINNLQTQLSKLNARSAELEQIHDTFVRRLNRLKSIEVSMQEEVRSNLTGKELLSLIEGEINKSVEKAKFYESTNQIDAIVGKTTKVKEVYDYLKNKEEVEQLEQELPRITKLVKDLKGRSDQLTMLESSLESIRQIALQYEKQIVTSTLESLKDSINRYYNFMKGHPYFSKLQLEIEKEEPIIYSIRAIGEKPSYTTYIPTRFSNAQMNIVAISLFLANNEKLTRNLSLLILDDPSQSLDNTHKSTFVALLKNLIKDRQIILITQDENLKNEVQNLIKEDVQLLNFLEWSTEGPKVES